MIKWWYTCIVMGAGGTVGHKSRNGGTAAGPVLGRLDEGDGHRGQHPLSLGHLGREHALGPILPHPAVQQPIGDLKSSAMICEG